MLASRYNNMSENESLAMRANDYESFARLAQTRKRKLCNNTYLVVRDDGGYGVRLHNTQVVIHYPDCIVLNSGGWQTHTTKERMNTCTPRGISVCQEKGVWYVIVGGRSGQTVAFADGITIYHDGTVAGEGADPKRIHKLCRQVNEYATRYADAMIAGEIPAPSMGDCWACAMVAQDGSRPMGGPDHILQHIEEGYLVPSMLKNATDGLPLIVLDFITRQWGEGEPRAPWGGRGRNSIEHDQIKRAIRKHCLRELNLPS